MKTIDKLLLKLSVAACVAFPAVKAWAGDMAAVSDSIAAADEGNVVSLLGAPLNYNVGVRGEVFNVPQTNMFLKGDNPAGKRIGSGASADIRAGFGFDARSRAGMLYRGIYQGVGVGLSGFFGDNLLGTPVAVYVFLGALKVHFNPRLWFGYEWECVAAFGWKH